MIYDVFIIGGGAAGLAAAVRIKRLSPSCSVAVAEQLPRVGKKLITTGNGRCNITNRDGSPERWHGEHPQFCRYALTNYNTAAVEDFFAQMGVLITYDETGRAYPYSLQASSVVDALRFTAEKFGVALLTETRITGFHSKQGKFTVLSDSESFECRTLVAAGGLYSGGEKLGSDGSILNILKAKGYPVIKTTPAIVPLKTDTEIVRSLKGIKVNAAVTLQCDGKTVRVDSGEVLFCEYGLSGPPIMQLSREVSRTPGKWAVLLDLMPEYSFAELCDILTARVQFLHDRTLDEFFTGMLNKRVGQAVLKKCGYRLTENVTTLKPEAVKTVASAIKKLAFTVTGTTGFINSQATAGGLDTSSFSEHTMMSHRDKGLFAIGEILDIDGDCGGFNLQWAWSSALCAAEAIINYLGDKQ